MNAIFVQFSLDNRVIVPEDEGIIIFLILENTELGIHIVLHIVLVTVQMIRSNVHQDGNVSTEIIHIVQLETTQLDDVVVVVTFSNLKSKALSDIAGQTYIQSCFLENVVYQGSRCSLSVASCNAYHFCIGISACEFNFRNNGSALCYQLLNNRGFVRNPRTFDDFICIQNKFFGMFPFFPYDTTFVKHGFVFVFNG